MEQTDGVFGVRINKASNIPSTKFHIPGSQAIKAADAGGIGDHSEDKLSINGPLSHWIFI